MEARDSGASGKISFNLCDCKKQELGLCCFTLRRYLQLGVGEEVAQEILTPGVSL